MESGVEKKNMTYVFNLLNALCVCVCECVCVSVCVCV